MLSTKNRSLDWVIKVNLATILLLVSFVATSGKCQSKADSTVITPPTAATNDTYPLTGGITIPMRYNFQFAPQPTIQLRINGSEPLNFVIDTGASGFFMADWKAKQLNLGINSVPGKGKSGFTIGFAQVNRVDIVGTPINLPIENFRIVDFLPETENTGSNQIVGILGVELLQKIPIRMDFSKGEMVMYISSIGHPPLNIRGAGHLKIQPDLRPQDAGLYTVDIEANKKKVPFVLRTSCVVTSLDEADRVQLGVTKEGSGVPFTNYVDNFSNGSGHFAQLNLGGLVLSNVPVITFPPSIGINTTLGMDILSRFRVTFDFTNQDIWLEPTNPDAIKATNFLTGSGAVIPRSVLNTIVVAEVHPPASTAGVQVGDQIVKVDGNDMKGLNVNISFRLIQGMAGTQAHLTLLRKGKIHEVSYKRESIFKPLDEPTGKALEGKLIR